MDNCAFHPADFIFPDRRFTFLFLISCYYYFGVRFLSTWSLKCYYTVLHSFVHFDFFFLPMDLYHLKHFKRVLYCIFTYIILFWLRKISVSVETHQLDSVCIFMVFNRRPLHILGKGFSFLLRISCYSYFSNFPFHVVSLVLQDFSFNINGIILPQTLQAPSLMCLHINVFSSDWERPLWVPKHQLSFRLYNCAFIILVSIHF